MEAAQCMGVRQGTDTVGLDTGLDMGLDMDSTRTPRLRPSRERVVGLRKRMVETVEPALMAK